MLTVATCAAVTAVLSAAVYTLATSSCGLPSISVPPVISVMPAIFGILSAPADFLFSALAQPDLLMADVQPCIELMSVLSYLLRHLLQFFEQLQNTYNNLLHSGLKDIHI
jgi:hypothetical protein